MAAHEPKYCPRCNALFECKPGDVANCQCSEAHIGATTRQFLEKSYWEDCLCKRCLSHFENLSWLSLQVEKPVNGIRPVEGIHYYKENNFWVFTELYHFQRGYCCQSGCRHCVYGFQPKQKQA